jgi:hypothetical protein
MKVIYKILPYSILMIAAGFLIGMAGGDSFWGYLGLGMIIASSASMLIIVMVVTFIHWRRNKAYADKKLNEVSVTLIFNAVVALLLFAYVTWKDIVILSDDNLFLVMWMAINLGALRVLWVPKESDEAPDPKAEIKIEEKKEEA